MTPHEKSNCPSSQFLKNKGEITLYHHKIDKTIFMITLCTLNFEFLSMLIANLGYV